MLNDRLIRCVKFRDRAGATHQTPLLEVQPAKGKESCENSTEYMDVPEQEESVSVSDSDSSSGSARTTSQPERIGLFIVASIGAVLAPALMSISI